MNTRFLELVQKASDYAYNEHDCNPDLDWYTLKDERLYELIIKECVDICVKGDTTQATSGGAALMIRHHFGIT